jgi:hypothetical protein
MPSWVSTFMGASFVLAAIIGFGALHFHSHRRFRVRGRLPTSAALERAERRLVVSAVATAAGGLLLIAFLSGAPRPFAWAGLLLGGAGFAALAIALVLVLRERWRRV